MIQAAGSIMAITSSVRADCEGYIDIRMYQHSSIYPWTILRRTETIRL